MADDEPIKDLETVLLRQLRESKELVKSMDWNSFQQNLDRRVAQVNDSFLKEVANISLISVTAAPFSLTLLLSGLEIEKTLLVAAFGLLMVNVLFLNVGLWHLNSIFKRETGSQTLDFLEMESNATDISNENLDTGKRVEALANLVKIQSRLYYRQKTEPLNQGKTLIFFREWGLVLLSVAIILIIESVVLALTK
ncbi:hypothetical protein A3D71_01295 [Candidatus Kaiserbacteria bacterium RIFCSPHIGHO2_02_FULL_55_20]|uniref:Uncharacterized protein n=1 Tax=Candidatus Kaiserbacteria bacterium RIFCSPHIGHO2_02_FULL_55_20 TaxID=1798497 RepID=A0A1F6DWF6_9BACT|nr:MAG: hypothetical protein A3D71_01295 [Candidatus Kaiserbacteria bacterium RIFCSPHIGHO2_02_FULL_55_20]